MARPKTPSSRKSANYVFTGGEKHFSGNNEVGANVEFLEMP
jgi:hypothetical protein